MVQPPTRWFVGFCDCELPFGLRRLMKRGFRHVFAMTYVADRDFWLFVEWTSYRMHVEILDGEQSDAVFARCRRECTLVEAPVVNMPPSCATPMVPVYCVSYVKQLIGLRGMIWTPFQLFRALQKHGGKIIFDASDREDAI